jgi:hypothetical protein
MRNTIVIALFALIFIGCSKDSFTTVPQLKYKSVNTNKLLPDQLIQFTLSYTDKEGDLQDSVFIEKVGAKCPASNLKLGYLFPKVSGNITTSGDLFITLANGINIPGYENLSIAPRCEYNDTCFFRFVLKDKAQNKSDTVESETIIIYK